MLAFIIIAAIVYLALHVNHVEDEKTKSAYFKHSKSYKENERQIDNRLKIISN